MDAHRNQDDRNPTSGGFVMEDIEMHDVPIHVNDPTTGANRQAPVVDDFDLPPPPYEATGPADPPDLGESQGGPPGPRRPRRRGLLGLLRPQRRGLACYQVVFLITGEMVGLAMHTMPHAFDALGILTAMIALFTIVGIYYYTSMTCWRLCLRHPEARNFAELSKVVFCNSCSRVGFIFSTSVWALGIVVSSIPPPDTHVWACTDT